MAFFVTMKRVDQIDLEWVRYEWLSTLHRMLNLNEFPHKIERVLHTEDEIKQTFLRVTRFRTWTFYYVV